jgi:plasmid maintenance system killer protein
MKIYFASRKLQKICSEEREMVKQLGAKRATRLMQRMMELQAASTLSVISHLPPPRCHELTGSDSGTFSVDLDHPYRLLFIAADDPLPLRADGGIDRDQVKEIEIVEIRDTH